MSLSRYVPVRRMAILINKLFMSPMMQFCFNNTIIILSGQSGCLVELYVSQKFRAGLFPFPSWSLGSRPFNFASTCGCSLSLVIVVQLNQATRKSSRDHTIHHPRSHRTSFNSIWQTIKQQQPKGTPGHGEQMKAPSDRITHIGTSDSPHINVVGDIRL